MGLVMKNRQFLAIFCGVAVFSMVLAACRNPTNSYGGLSQSGGNNYNGGNGNTVDSKYLGTYKCAKIDDMNEEGLVPINKFFYITIFEDYVNISDETVYSASTKKGGNISSQDYEVEWAYLYQEEVKYGIVMSIDPPVYVNYAEDSVTDQIALGRDGVSRFLSLNGLNSINIPRNDMQNYDNIVGYRYSDY